MEPPTSRPTGGSGRKPRIRRTGLHGGNAGSAGHPPASGPSGTADTGAQESAPATNAHPGSPKKASSPRKKGLQAPDRSRALITRTPGRENTAATRGRTREKSTQTPVARFWNWVEGDPHKDGRTGYYLILGSTLALTVIGLMMVLSSSSVEAISSNPDASSYDQVIKQGVWAVVGVAMMLIISRFSLPTFKKLAWPALFISAFLLLLVLTPLGLEIYGNKNWIKIGSLTFQPSEAAKLALAVWAASVLSKKSKLIDQTSHALIPVLFPGGVLLLGLVMVGRDLGTALVIGLVLVATLFLGGVRLKLFAAAGVLGAIAAVVMVMVSGNRMTRIYAWLGLNCDTQPGACYQSTQGIYALASGGWWGVGLGQSRQKWNYIPEASNDFIFTILGEELGLLGTLVVVVLFAILAIAMYRVAARHQDGFVRIATGGIMAWLIGQAFLNIGMVTGLLPVIGVPLPFISSGGSALLLSLMAVGVVLCFARSRPDASSELPTEATTPGGTPRKVRKANP
ncbi:MAG: putative lipid II flippase FtsW [Arthrobacter sp.]|uniref:putative lipid II flippase FtsW n=1 Tax=unclassified Arthrobacter TaxID=235627 RepID=UPI00264D3B02|nr:putative lipid II flippase FtsW [Micrococcaceae bacterium]